MGEMGDMGDPGTKGDKGDMGDMGNMGTPGEDGTNGANGMNGSDGLACWDLNGNGACDAAAEDKNADTMCTVIDCQGPVGPAGPAGATAGQGAGSVFGNASVTVAPSSGDTAVPGLAINVTVPATGQYIAYISSNGGLVIPDSETDPEVSAVVSVYVRINNVLRTAGGFQNHLLLNASQYFANWSFSTTTGVLAAGTHTITLHTANATSSTADVTVSGGADNGLQGNLNVLLLKL